jgi:hypothetical protein
MAPVRGELSIAERLRDSCSDLLKSGGRCYRMKKLASSIAILSTSLFIAACSGNQARINDATQKAQSDAQRAEAAATAAQTASQNAMAASQKADQEAASAQDSVRRANDAVARLEAAFSTSVTK